MLLSLNWLKEYVTIPRHITPEKLGDMLKSHVVEVEGFTVQGENLRAIVVGKVTSVQPHPNADKLRLVSVSDGKKSYVVVCGGSNLYEGMLVAFAKVGAQVRWHGQGDLVTLEPAVIRGERSEGMICAAGEIGLADMFPASDEREIIDLMGAYTVGAPLAEALGLNDVIYDIDNKSITHRPDLWGHYGIARELATLLSVKLQTPPAHRLGKTGGTNIKVAVKDSAICPRYMAVAMTGINVAPSPAWLQARLVACGLRPINNIVDVTNYVMLELGQPAHAFDMSRISTNIVVRAAQKGETITTLDGIERKLNAGMLVIADSEKPIAIAGIMGGEHLGIDSQTAGIIIEVANFNPLSIRKTSQALNLRTDASARFEKSLDPNLCETALGRIVSLIREIIPTAVVAGPVRDIKKFKLNQGPVTVDTAWLQGQIGAPIKTSDITAILKKLGFETLRMSTKGREALRVKIPTWRATKDISIAQDIVEEVARIYGYNNIKGRMPLVTMQRPAVNEQREFCHSLRTMLMQIGMTETYAYSFVNETQLEKLGVDSQTHIRLANPLSGEHTLLRQSLLPNLLEHVIVNQRNYDRINLFEIGSVYLSRPGELYSDHLKKEKLFQQPRKLGLICARDNAAVFFTLKGRLEKLADLLHITIETTHEQGRIVIKANDVSVGWCIVMDNHSDTAKRTGLKMPTAYAEFDIDELYQAQSRSGSIAYREKHIFPYLMRDMAFVMDAKIVYNDIKKEILHISELVRDVNVFDVYAGDKVAAGAKSLAMHITFGSNEKTLTGKEVDAVQDEIVAVLQKKFGAQLRNF